MRPARCPAPIAGLLLLLASAPFQPATSFGQEREPVWVLRGVTLIDGTGRTELHDRDIVIRGERIECIERSGHCKVPPEADELDRQGYYVIPGLWNSHAHITMPITYLFLSEGLSPGDAARLRRAMLRIYLASGVTGLVLLADDVDAAAEIRAAERERELIAPRLFTCAWGVPTPHSWNDFGGGGRVDCVKIYLETGPGPVHTHPRMPLKVVRALVKQAHRQGLPVYVHATHVEAIEDAVDAGVDVLAHGVEDAAAVPHKLVAEMLSRGTYYTPTLVLYHSFFRYIDHPKLLDEPWIRSRLTTEMYGALTDSARQARFIEQFNTLTHGAGLEWARADFPRTRAATEQVLAAGVTPLVGTDPVWFVMPGYDVHRELELLVEAGLSPKEAIRAATYHAARALRRSKDFGTVEPGKYADFLILESNPLERIRNTRAIDLVVKGGQVFNPYPLLGTVGAGY